MTKAFEQTGRATITGIVDLRGWSIEDIKGNAFCTFKVAFLHNKGIKCVAKLSNEESKTETIGDWIVKELKPSDQVTIEGLVIVPMSNIWVRVDNIKIHNRPKIIDQTPTPDFSSMGYEDFNSLISDTYKAANSKVLDAKKKEREAIKKEMLQNIYFAASAGRGYFELVRAVDLQGLTKDLKKMCASRNWDFNSEVRIDDNGKKKLHYLVTFAAFDTGSTPLVEWKGDRND